MFKETVYVGYDNLTELLLELDDVPKDLSATTEVRLHLDNGTIIKSGDFPASFDWATEGASGILKLKLGVLAAFVAGNTYFIDLIIFDPVNVNGIHWGKFFVEAISEAPTAPSVVFPTPTGAENCRVYEYCFKPDGETPVDSVTAKARIVSLPENLGGMLFTGEVVDGVYIASSGLLYWDVPQTSKVEFTIIDFGVRVTKTIPAAVDARLADIT